MNSTKVCVAGVNQRFQVWFGFSDKELVECSVESSSGHQEFPFFDTYREHFLVLRVDPVNGPKKNSRGCTYLTSMAGKKAAKAVQDNSLKDLAEALTLQYGWQIANQALPLPGHGSIAKIYADGFGVYVFETPGTRLAVEKRLKQTSASD